MSIAKDSTLDPIRRAVGRFPDTEILFDDDFQREPGYHGWQELHTNPNVATTGPTIAPLSLSHPSMPGGCLAQVTRSTPDPGIQSQSVAMKRATHRQPPGLTVIEDWFAFGGESQTGASPRDIMWAFDSMYGGIRHFFKLRYRYWDESTGTRDYSWYLASAGEDLYIDSGFDSDLPWNGNKGSEIYLKFTVDLAAGEYHSLEVNADRFDLTGAPAVAPGANGDATFNDPLFNNGLNYMKILRNRSSQPLMGWTASSRIRGSVRSAA